MTDRTERNRVFSNTKIMVIAAMSLIFNYAFVIVPRYISYCPLPNKEFITCFGLLQKYHNEILISLTGIYLSIVTLAGIYADVLLNR